MAGGTLVQAPLTGKVFLQSSHIAFFGGRSGDGLEETYKTSFQTDFNSPATLSKRGAIPRPIPAQVQHKDLGRIKEYLTETVKSYPHHPLIPLNRTSACTKFCTNVQMHKDPRQVTFLTTHADDFQHRASSLTRSIRPFVNIKKNQVEEELPQSTYSALFTPYNIFPIVKAKVKHIGRRDTIKEDMDGFCFVTHHNNVFQGKCGSPSQPLQKQFKSSVVMGDQEKILEMETTHGVSFSHPGTTTSPVNTKKDLKINLGDFSENRWTSTMADAFCGTKSEPVLLKRGNRSLSSIPRGDTDAGRNQRMMATTNGLFFSERNHTEHPVHFSGANVRTRSNVEFGRPSLNGLYYSTAAQEDYPKRQIIRTRQQARPSGHMLAGKEPGPAMTTFQSDFHPLNSQRQELNPRQLHQIKFGHIVAPYAEQHFSTTHNEAFGPKPLSRTYLDIPPNQNISHISI
ncbi:hypothetical protein UPYG_G00038000 [Umbra pygmaea]|uniref:Uncharacterized protein n=1 Tax=Umbra pygmaea TaxID=75934 RepID=A0ABD0XPC5_UMBPY